MEKKTDDFCLLKRDGHGGKQGIKAVAFLGAFLAIFSFLQFIFQAKWYNDSNTYARGRLFYREEPSPDVVLIGSSHVYYGINPLVMFQEYGVTGYDFSMPSQGAEVTYLYVKEAIRTAKPKVIGVEVGLMHDLTRYEDRSRQWLDAVPLSPLKMQTAWSVVENNEKYGLGMETDSFLSYLFPLLRYHTRWNGLIYNDFVLDQNVQFYHGAAHYHGYGPRYRTLAVTFGNYESEWSCDAEVAAEAKKYFEKIVEACAESGTELFLFEMPSADWRKSQHDLIDGWATECGVDFLDFSISKDEMGVDETIDFFSANHLNDSGAAKVSRALGRYLAGTYDLTDHRDDPAYASWNDDWEVYQRDKASYFLATETDWASYVEKLKDPNYTVYIAVKDNVGGAAHPELASKLSELGLSGEVETAGTVSYMAIIDRGTVVYENLKGEPLEYETEINGHHVKLVSQGWTVGNSGSIQLDWKEQFVDRRGIGIVVYDDILEDVVDRVTFDLYDGGRAYR